MSKKKRIKDLEYRVFRLEKIVLKNALSKTAMDNYPDTQSLLGIGPEIIEWTHKAYAGEAFNDDPKTFPLNVEGISFPARRDVAKQYIADIYCIEASDIDILIELF